MNMLVDVQSMGTGILLDTLEQCVAERTTLIYTDAPEVELKIVQTKIDAAKQELLRRSW